MNSTNSPPGLEQAPRASLVQLRSLEAVVRLGGVGRAARALHLAQPTVSTQLKELASTLGLALFEPRGRGLVPTAVAERLAQAVREMGAAWQAFEDDAAALQGLRRGRLRIAAVTTTEYFLPDLLGRFARQYPGIAIELAVENRNAVVARLERGDDELTGEPLLTREAGSGTRAAAEQAFAACGVQWPPRMALGSNEAVKHAVRAGLGLAVLSRHTLAPDPASDGLAVLEVVGFPLRRQWQLVWRQDRALSLPARTLLDDLRARLQVRAKARV